MALSATVPDPARTAAAYLGVGTEIVRIPGERELEARVLVSAGDEITRARQAMEAASSFGDVRKVLVFVNSRRQVDTGTDLFRHERFPGVTVYGRKPAWTFVRSARAHSEANGVDAPLESHYV